MLETFSNTATDSTGISDQDVTRSRATSTPDALTIIDPHAPRIPMRRLSDGMEIL